MRKISSRESEPREKVIAGNRRVPTDQQGSGRSEKYLLLVNLHSITDLLNKYRVSTEIPKKTPRSERSMNNPDVMETTRIDLPM